MSGREAEQGQAGAGGKQLDPRGAVIPRVDTGLLRTSQRVFVLTESHGKPLGPHWTRGSEWAWTQMPACLAYAAYGPFLVASGHLVGEDDLTSHLLRHGW